MEESELRRRFEHHPPSGPEIVRAHEQVRSRAYDFASWLNRTLPESREKSQALTAVDDAAMHANACVARHQTVTLEDDDRG